MSSLRRKEKSRSSFCFLPCFYLNYDDYDNHELNISLPICNVVYLRERDVCFAVSCDVSSDKVIFNIKKEREINEFFFSFLVYRMEVKNFTQIDRIPNLFKGKISFSILSP